MTRLRPAAGVILLGLSIHSAAASAQLAAAHPAAGSPRSRYTLNQDWRFLADGVQFAEKPAFPDSAWIHVNLPHTWNSKDPFDDQPGYRRGVSWYRKYFRVPDSLKGQRILVYFEGVNQEADVYVNGAFVAQHKGGYTAFSADITKELRFDPDGNSNMIAVRVDNSHDPFVPPLSVGFALYGGIYRDVWLVGMNPVHVTTSDHGSSGVQLSTPGLTRESGMVRVRGSVSNETPGVRNVTVVNTLRDARGAVVAQHSTVLKLAPMGEAAWDDTLPRVRHSHLWSPDDPYLYSVRTEIRDGTSVLDRVDNPLGFRWFEFDSSKGFFLNGSKLQLRGTNRHQDYQGLGSALSDSLHVQDLRWIKNMGANFVRLAHYPQDPAVLAAADSLGLLIWEEIPVVNYITPRPAFAANSAAMLREMIRQHFNHPSVIMWGLMNEVFLWSPEGFRIRKQADPGYMSAARSFSVLLDSIARAEDPTRVTTMAVHGSSDYDTSGVSSVTDVLGQNIYSGWYSGMFEDFGKQLDRRHATRPSENIFVSEYGAEDDARVNSLEPSRFDFSGTWMRRFHESYLRQINLRPWLSGSAVWSQFDFSQPETGGSIPYLNQKGMQTWDRKPKDVYYLYKANWTSQPMVYIASRGWQRRLGKATPQPIDIYSNLPSVELFVSGKSQGVKVPDDVHRATWDVSFAPGVNEILARGVGKSAATMDRMQIQFNLRPDALSKFAVPTSEFAVNAGGKAQYAQSGGPVWEADQAYVRGDFGYVGGEPRMLDKDLPIKGSADTPLFFTYQSGLTAYHLDLADGDYELELLFAEPDAKPGNRIFSVGANGSLLAKDLDLSARYGIGRAVTIGGSVSARNGSGITVEFAPSRGKAILNAIRVRRSKP